MRLSHAYDNLCDNPFLTITTEFIAESSSDIPSPSPYIVLFLLVYDDVTMTPS